MDSTLIPQGNAGEHPLAAVAPRITKRVGVVDFVNFIAICYRRRDRTGPWYGIDDEQRRSSIRVAEYHRMGPGGELRDPRHYDLDSLVTVDVMLTRRGTDFEGGDFQTMETDGTLQKHAFELGDALLFVSHKRHCVGTVTSGERSVLVCEIWRGVERNCPHRCERFGDQYCLHPSPKRYPHFHFWSPSICS